MPFINLRKTERLIRQAQFQRAISGIRKHAQETGLDRISEEEIAEEIRLARAERAERKL